MRIVPATTTAGVAINLNAKFIVQIITSVLGTQNSKVIYNHPINGLTVYNCTDTATTLQGLALNVVSITGLDELVHWLNPDYLISMHASIVGDLSTSLELTTGNHDDLVIACEETVAALTTAINALVTFVADSTGTNAFTGNNSFTKGVTFGAANALNSTPYTAGTDTTAGWTLADVTAGLIAGVLKTTSAAAVTLTLDSVANIITAFGVAGITLATGSEIVFSVDNSQGSNTVTLAVDGGATISVGTTKLTGGITLTTSTAQVRGKFSLYFTSATTAKLNAII